MYSYFLLDRSCFYFGCWCSFASFSLSLSIVFVIVWVLPAFFSHLRASHRTAMMKWWLRRHSTQAYILHIPTGLQHSTTWKGQRGHRIQYIFQFFWVGLCVCVCVCAFYIFRYIKSDNRIQFVSIFFRIIFYCFSSIFFLLALSFLFVVSIFCAHIFAV